MLFISGEEILTAALPDELMDAIELAYKLYEKGEYEMPTRLQAEYEGNTSLAMPCFTKGRFGTKLVSVFPGNLEKGKPVITGLMVLNDGETGEPVALLNASALTAVRTAAVGGVAARYLAPAKVAAGAVIGAGVQGFYHALFAASVCGLTNVTFYDKDRTKAESAAKRLAKLLHGVKAEVAAAPEEAVDTAGIIITATPSETPVLPDEPGLFKGKHITAVGSFKPAMRELPKAAFDAADELYVDTGHALEEAGDLIVPIEKGWIKETDIIPMSTFLKRIKKKEKVYTRQEGATTLFKSVGMALFDITVAELIFMKARNRGFGKEVTL